MKQALTEALARFERTLDLAALDPDRVSDDIEWLMYEDDCGRLLGAARLVERLLPGECEHGSTEPHKLAYGSDGRYCDGQVWDEGIVEAVAKYLGEFAHFSEDRARGVLAVLVELLTEKAET